MSIFGTVKRIVGQVAKPIEKAAAPKKAPPPKKDTPPADNPFVGNRPPKTKLPNGRTPENEARRDAVLKRAKSMLGFNEYSDTGKIQKVTKIDPRGDKNAWCSAFAMNLLKEQGLQDLAGLSNRNYVPTVSAWARDKKIWQDSPPNPSNRGDAIVFNGEQHIGLVDKVKNGKVYTVEGNSDDAVRKQKYDVTDPSIDGIIRSKQT